MNIDVAKIEPQRKDYERALDFDWDKTMGRRSFYGSGAPFAHNAEKMSKLIKDPVKLIRRAKAVVAVWGTRDYTGYSGGIPKEENVWKPFARALREMGLDGAQITIVINHRVDEDFLRSLR